LYWCDADERTAYHAKACILFLQVVAKPRDINDHISWLLVRERFEEALAAAEQFQRFLKGHQIKKIGQDFLNHLTQTKQWEKVLVVD